MDETNSIIGHIINDYMPISQQDIKYQPNLRLETINLPIELFRFPGFMQELPTLESISPPHVSRDQFLGEYVKQKYEKTTGQIFHGVIYNGRKEFGTFREKN
ncbi:hypothetical protein K3495_g8639 [Podosphaera aphanis]|nr:hypothetical protein K3495_g8639 [Podosphaera aphanis]